MHASTASPPVLQQRHLAGQSKSEGPESVSENVSDFTCETQNISEYLQYLHSFIIHLLACEDPGVS